MMMIHVSKKKKKSNIYDYPCMSIICKWDGPMVHKQTNTKKKFDDLIEMAMYKWNETDCHFSSKWSHLNTNQRKKNCQCETK